ncbi:MAG: hypothetical protein AAF442_05390 [Pseudomonadota bacterium]
MGTKEITIARVGTHTASNGTKVDLNPDTLAAVASHYDPGKHEAPMVLGHPRTDGPAHGWVKGLRMAGDTLKAEVGEMNDEVVKAVRSGGFKKVSPAFYPPDSPHNPTPGSYHLRHVGLLGAATPAIKGLGRVEFADGDEQALTIEFADEQRSEAMSEDVTTKTNKPDEEGGTVKAMLTELRSLVDKLAGKSDKPSKADKGEQANAPSDVDKAAADKKTQEALAQAQKRIAELETAQAKASKTDAAEKFIDKQVAAGKVLPAEKDKAIAFMASLDGGAEIEFADGDAQSPADYFKGFIQALPSRVEFAEIAAAGKEQVDIDNAEALARAGRAYADKHGVAIDEAVDAVKKDTNKEDA